MTPAQFAIAIPRRVEAVKRYAGFAIWNGVTQKNPVDTGRSRAAWNVQVTDADLSVPAKPAKGTTIAAPPPPPIGQIPAGVPLVVSNNLPYIVPLEHGSSKQAPQGFVQATVDEVAAALGPIAERVRRLDESRA